MITTRVIPVYVVLPPRLLLLDVSGPLEVLRRANEEQQTVRFEVRYVGVSRTLHTSIGLDIRGVGALPRVLPDDVLVLVPGHVDLMMDGTPRSRTDLEHETRIVDWLSAAIQPCHCLLTICSGALLAGRAGLLDGYACTTHFLSCVELAEVAPRARVLDNRLYVEDRNRLSSAGVTAGIDLMLHLIVRFVGHATALAVARYLVVYLRRAGSDPQLSPWLEGRSHINPVIHRVQDAIASDPAALWPAQRLAKLSGTSTRQLSRLFREHVGMHIADYRNRLRAALAYELLSQTRLGMERIAERAGFSSARQLRRVWQGLHGIAPRDQRRNAYERISQKGRAF